MRKALEPTHFFCDHRYLASGYSAHARFLVELLHSRGVTAAVHGRSVNFTHYFRRVSRSAESTEWWSGAHSTCRWPCRCRKSPPRPRSLFFRRACRRMHTPTSSVPPSSLLVQSSPCCAQRMARHPLANYYLERVRTRSRLPAVTDKNKDPKRVAMRKAVLERGGCVVTYPIEGAVRAAVLRCAHSVALTS